MSAAPRFTLLVPLAADGAGPAALAATVASLRAQVEPDWQLVAVRRGASVPASELPEPADRRVRTIAAPADAAAAAVRNQGVDAVRGEWLACLGPGDTLEPAALARVRRAFAADPEVDCVYTDEDLPGLAGSEEREDVRKPDWSPERLRHGDYIGRLCAMRTTLARDVGGFRSWLAGALDYDLTLRVTERARRVVHVPEVLCHRRVRPRPADPEQAMRAAQDQLDRLGIAATAAPGPALGYHRIDRRVDPELAVSIVMPTRGTRGTAWGRTRCYAVEAVRSALAKTTLAHVEIVVVHDESTPPDVLDALREAAGERIVLVGYDRPFNFSEKTNLGVLRSNGEIVVLLNDDIEAKTQGWLETLVAPLAEPDVGMTGARLLFEDGSIQAGGHSYRYGADLPRPYSAYRETPGDDPGELGALIVDRESSGVTAACAALRRDVYDRVGGLTETLPVNFNDVDLSLKLRYLGMRVLWLAGCELYHFESRTREARVQRWEKELLAHRWGGFTRDPYLRWSLPTG